MKPVSISGQVTRFKGNGRQLGYPTANITTATDQAEGIYFGFATLASFTNQPALIFIGIPTTLGDHDRRIEVHLLDIPDVDYYDKTLTTQLMHFHRPNQRFKTVEALLGAMHGDEQQARKWLQENPLAKPSKVGDT